MKKKFSNTLMMTAITALLSISYASAATVNVTVHNKEKNPNPMFLKSGNSLSKQFSGDAGSHVISNVPNRVYPMLLISFHSHHRGTSVSTYCKESDLPGAPALKKIDLDGHNKHFDLIVKVDEQTGRHICFQAGG